jgi:hypothetical protein
VLKSSQSITLDAVNVKTQDNVIVLNAPKVEGTSGYDADGNPIQILETVAAEDTGIIFFNQKQGTAVDNRHHAALIHDYPRDRFEIGYTSYDGSGNVSTAEHGIIDLSGGYAHMAGNEIHAYGAIKTAQSFMYINRSSVHNDTTTYMGDGQQYNKERCGIMFGLQGQENAASFVYDQTGNELDICGAEHGGPQLGMFHFLNPKPTLGDGAESSTGVSQVFSDHAAVQAGRMFLGAVFHDNVDGIAGGDDPSHQTGSQVNGFDIEPFSTFQSISMTGNIPLCVGMINNDGYAAAFHGPILSSTMVSTSDRRLKHDIQKVDGALDMVERINTVTFRWNDPKTPYTNKDYPELGVIAQELEEVVPHCVHTDSTGLKTVAYERLSTIALQAIKELKAEVDALKAELANRG